MNSIKSYQKRLVLRDTNEKGFDIWRFTISLHQSNITVTSIENGRQKIIKATIVHIIREGITVEAYVSIRNRNPPLYTGPSYEEKEKKFMVISITMIISFPSVLMINSYSYQTLKQHFLPSTKKILTT